MKYILIGILKIVLVFLSTPIGIIIALYSLGKNDAEPFEKFMEKLFEWMMID